METFERSGLFLGEQTVEQLKTKTVAVLGVGGVGSFCVEALARTGIGHLILVDADTVEPSNINRQLVATTETIGQVKVEIMKERIRTINPDCQVTCYAGWYDQTMDETLFGQPVDFVVDAIDSIPSKKDLIRACLQREIPFCCSMGMARRIGPEHLIVTELEKTTMDPMAKQLRIWKRKERIKGKIPVVTSTEAPIPHPSGTPLPSLIFVPAAAGLLLASVCIRTLIQEEQ